MRIKRSRQALAARSCQKRNPYETELSHCFTNLPPDGVWAPKTLLPQDYFDRESRKPRTTHGRSAFPTPSAQGNYKTGHNDSTKPDAGEGFANAAGERIAPSGRLRLRFMQHRSRQVRWLIMR